VPALDDEARDEQRIQELQKALERAHRATAAAKHRTDDLVEAVYSAARDAALAVGAATPVARPSRDRRKGPEVALLHLTDIQYGKVTPTYSAEVAEERIRRVVQKAIRLTEIMRADHPVRDCHLMLGGDLGEGAGSIFPGQAFLVDSSAFQQVFGLAALLESVILALLEVFENVTVYEVPGNHGRLGRKGDMPKGDNLDLIVGKIVRDRLATQPRLAWGPLYDGFYSIVAIGSYRALLIHGDQVKSFGGAVPAYGLLRRGNSWAAGGIEQPFDDIYVGHMHQEMTLTLASGGRIYMTPSPEDSNQYATEFMGATGRPGQRLHFVHPERGVTAVYMIDPRT
jgi:hypothetical protein